MVPNKSDRKWWKEASSDPLTMSSDAVSDQSIPTGGSLSDLASQFVRSLCQIVLFVLIMNRYYICRHSCDSNADGIGDLAGITSKVGCGRLGSAKLANDWLIERYARISWTTSSPWE